MLNRCRAGRLLLIDVPRGDQCNEGTKTNMRRISTSRQGHFPGDSQGPQRLAHAVKGADMR